MSNQIVISSGAKVRELEGVLTGTSGIVNALGINVPDGIPKLDGSGKILVSQLPNSVMEYKGTWNAATNTPTLANGTGNQGDVYLVSVAGTTNFGAGPITFAVGDQTIYSGTIWQKAGGSTGTVTSVSVTESGDALSITGSPITTSGTINIGFNGTSGQYVNGAGGLTTFPSLTGYVPYTGATADVNLGANDLSAENIYVNGDSTTNFGNLGFKQIGGSGSTGLSGYTSIYASGQTDLYFNYSTSGGFRKARFSSVLIADNAERLYYLPASDGTLALTSQLTSGTVTSVGLSSATSGVTIGSSPITTSGTITLAIATASGSQNGLLSSTDWTTFNNKASTASLANYLLLSGGTLTGQLSILRGSGTGLDVASDLVVFRAATGFSTPRQITLAAGNGATTYLEAKGYGGNYITDFGIRTYNASGTAFEVFFATSAGNVGIGNTAPSAKLDISGTGKFSSSLTATTNLSVLASSNDGSTLKLFTSSTVPTQANSFILTPFGNAIFSSNIIYSSASGYLYDQTGFGATIRLSGGFSNNGSINFNTFISGTGGAAATELNRMIITNAGNVGIGTSSPSNKLDVRNGGDFDVKFRSDAAGGTVGILLETANTFSGTSQAYVKCIGSSGGGQSQLIFGTAGASGDASATERMRITSGGQLLIGTTSAVASSLLGVVGDTSSFNLIVAKDTGASYADNWYVYCLDYLNNRAGGIQHISLSSVLFITTSDYRLKENARPIENALNKVLALKPITYDWKTDGAKGEGFYAHELQEHIPMAVSGVKDAVDKNGKINPQGIDLSKVVPYLVKAIQEQQAQIEELKAKIK